MITIKEFEKKSGIRFNLNMSGKMAGVNCLSTSNLVNPFCMQESADLKARIAKAEEDAPPVERNLEPLEQLLSVNFRSSYEQLDAEHKRRLWRSAIKEIIVEKNDVKGVIFL